MNIDFNEVIRKKLEQMEADGVIQKKIEDALEESIMKAIDDQLGNWQFRSSLGKQLEASVSKVAADCGLSAYNTFITERVKVIVEQLASEDLAKKSRRLLMKSWYKNTKISSCPTSSTCTVSMS